MASKDRLQYLKRGILNKCPRCGVGAILKSLFVRHHNCPHCRMDFTRESGFYSGAMAINYAIVCVFYLLPLLLIWGLGWLSGRPTIILSFLGSAVIPILFYRYSQFLWLGFYCSVTSEDLQDD